MTDKEMAKEYEEKAEYVDINDDGKKIYDSLDIQQAFLAGLEAGRSPWHDLRENPNDLPPEGIELLVSVDGYTRTAMYSKGTKSFTCQEGVIAWMYKPEFV